jgi:hypothetical protein
MADDDKMSDDDKMAADAMNSDDDKMMDDDKMAADAMKSDDDKMAGDAMMSDDKKSDGAMMTDDAVMSDDDKKSGDAMMSDDAMMVHEDHEFTVRIENISSGASVPSPLAPGAYVIHSSVAPIFTAGQIDRGDGLEGLAEDGGGDALAAAISGNDGISAAAGFAATANTGEPGPALPGDAYEFTFTASSGERLSFATMFVQSNDLFFATAPAGIAFWNEAGEVLDGDITSQIMLWDAGTEVNEAPGEGPNQAPRQSAAGEGTQESSAINLVADEFTYPDTDKVIKVTITSSK